MYRRHLENRYHLNFTCSTSFAMAIVRDNQEMNMVDISTNGRANTPGLFNIVSEHPKRHERRHAEEMGE